jgi:phosphoribosyl-ATP pyrophosphohydrolase
MPNVLTRLAHTIEARKGEDAEKSYAAKLFSRGPEKCAEKFGEEAVEAIIAAAKGDTKNLTEEAADVLFHLLIMLSSRGVKYEDVLTELERREGKSGIIEKQERKKK